MLAEAAQLTGIPTGVAWRSRDSAGNRRKRFSDPGMYWDDMCDYFDGIEPDSVSSTVTVTQNTAFGSMASSTSAGCEIRVSWTPLDRTGRTVLWTPAHKSARGPHSSDPPSV